MIVESTRKHPCVFQLSRESTVKLQCLSKLLVSNVNLHPLPLHQVSSARSRQSAVQAVDTHRAVDPACVESAFDFNFLKVHSFQAVGFKSQPASLRKGHGRAALLRGGAPGSRRGRALRLLLPSTPSEACIDSRAHEGLNVIASSSKGCYIIKGVLHNQRGVT